MATVSSSNYLHMLWYHCNIIGAKIARKSESMVYSTRVLMFSYDWICGNLCSHTSFYAEQALHDNGCYQWLLNDYHFTLICFEWITGFNISSSYAKIHTNSQNAFLQLPSTSDL